MKLMISTQYMENYGAHDWDGTGECPQYWKAKGGEDYFYPLGDRTLSADELSEIVDQARPHVEWADEASTQWILGWEVVSDDYLTEFERDQLEYSGEIKYPARTLDFCFE